jgi:hypothetical protein
MQSILERQTRRMIEACSPGPFPGSQAVPVLGLVVLSAASSAASIQGRNSLHG